MKVQFDHILKLNFEDSYEVLSFRMTLNTTYFEILPQKRKLGSGFRFLIINLEISANWLLRFSCLVFYFLAPLHTNPHHLSCFFNQ